MQRTCCVIFAWFLALATLILIISLWHRQTPHREFWSHRCRSDNGNENELTACRAALHNFDGIEVDVRWNGNLSTWDNHSFWLHHDDASMSSTTLTQLLSMVSTEFAHKKVYLDCKFRDLQPNTMSLVRQHLLHVIALFALKSENLVIEWNIPEPESPYSTISINHDADIWVATPRHYFLTYAFFHKPTRTILYFASFQTWIGNMGDQLESIWLTTPCLRDAFFDAGVQTWLWDDSHPPEKCHRLYPSLLAWVCLLYVVILGMLMQCVVVYQEIRSHRQTRVYVPLN